jgi:protein TonB
MEVTLAQHRSNNQPDKADFLAQFNQQGSGTLEKKTLTTTPTEAEFFDTVVRETSPKVELPSTPRAIEQLQSVVTTSREVADKAVVQTDLVNNETGDSDSPVKKTLLERSLEIASLEARLDHQRQIHAKRPRIKRLTSLSTKSSSDAYYLNSWRRKIEKIGNLN